MYACLCVCMCVCREAGKHLEVTGSSKALSIITGLKISQLCDLLTVKFPNMWPWNFTTAADVHDICDLWRVHCEKEEKHESVMCSGDWQGCEHSLKAETTVDKEEINSVLLQTLSGKLVRFGQNCAFLSCELRSFCALHLVCFLFYIMPLMQTPLPKITGRNKLWPVPTVLFLCVWLYKYGLVSCWCCLHPNGECWNELPAHDALWAGSGVIFWMDDSQWVLLGQSRQVGNCVGYTDFFFPSN